MACRSVFLDLDEKARMAMDKAWAISKFGFLGSLPEDVAYFDYHLD